MNPTDKRAREWWITGNRIAFDFEPTKEMEIREVFHVIEKSAYDALKADNARLEECLKDSHEDRSRMREAERERDELKGALELASQDVIDRANERDALKVERDEIKDRALEDLELLMVTAQERDAWRAMCEQLAGVLKEATKFGHKDNRVWLNADQVLTAFEALKRGEEGK